ncbi:MAG: hypothetical protein H7Y43_17600 [Akkermansiaceae bacterium]|nr:hypothetical protein [Verrucomicrobiales bacterium]
MLSIGGRSQSHNNTPYQSLTFNITLEGIYPPTKLSGAGNGLGHGNFYQGGMPKDQL